MMPRFLTPLLLAGSVALSGLAAAQFDSGGPSGLPPRKPSEGSLGPLLDSLLLRELGPTNMAGRIMQVCVDERQPRRFLVATASGGLYKTENAGNTFVPLFQQEGSISLGAVAMAPSNPNVIYVGTGEQSSRNSVAWGDGVYRSDDGGLTWHHLGLTETRHIGRIVVDPKNPDVVYVAALGRLWGRNEERGVYRSTNGGRTWRLVLNNGDRAGAVDLDMDPKDPRTLYATLWDRRRYPYLFVSGGMESGLWKTTDGGEHWRPLTKGLPGGKLGRIAVSVYRKDPRVLVALVEYAVPGATKRISENEEEEREEQEREDREREEGGALNLLAYAATPFGRTPQTTGTGQTGTGQTGTGQTGTGQGAPPPTAPIPAKPGQTTSTQTPPKKTDAAKPDENDRKPPIKPVVTDPRMTVPQGSQMNGGGMFLSRDGGESWTFLRQMNPRPFYFSEPMIDPNDPKKVYLGGLNLMMTPDLGKTWRNVTGGTHADHHSIWIDPKDSNHIITGCDGGVNVSYDGTKTWDVLQSMAIGQFYAVDYDGQRPYWVYGGLQDNGCWAIPTQSANGGVGFWDAQSLNGGDGFFVRVDRKNPAIVYSESQGGAVAFLNRATGERRSVRAAMGRAEGLRKLADGKTEPLRLNWNTPIELGLHTDDTVYVGAQRLLRSIDQGKTFRAISPDLTTNSPTKQATEKLALALSVNAESTGAEQHCTIVTIAESPVTTGVIATGSDDGRVNLTTDDGKSWTDVTPPGMPEDAWCTRVILSRWSPTRMYATFDNHRNDDFRPYLYVSEDLGKTWRSIAAGLPDHDCLYVVREDPRVPEMLYLGSEMSLRVSDDRGASWTRLRGGFPTVAVHDLQINDRDGDLIIGTHGRAIWTLDLEPLEQSAFERFADVKATRLFVPQAAVRMPFVTGGGWEGDRYFVARNSMPGTTIYYRLGPGAKEVRVRVRSADGKLSTQIEGSEKAGMNSVKWNGRLGQTPAAPGKYVVELDVDGEKTTTEVEVVDPIRY